MTIPEADQRSKERQALDDRIAAEPKMPPLELPPSSSSPVETHLARHRRRPLAVLGVVENGLIRLLDPTVILPEHSRVIIVASEQI
jgi:hypothetical protein